MSISPVSPITPQAFLDSAAPVAAATSAGFGQAIINETNALNAQLVKADQTLEALANGSPVSLHEAMIQIEETQLAFQTLVQFRNKVLESYQEILKMQV
jgi:flagellar hook-basal body complex protein FliE